MPAGQRGVQDQSDYGWITFDDFTAGIYDYTSVPGTAPNIPGAGKAPADPDNTWQCIALPSGGLGPLPYLEQTYPWLNDVNDSGPNYIVGFLAHNELAEGGVELFSIWETDNGTDHDWAAFSWDSDSDTSTQIVDTVNPSAPGIFGSPYPYFTRMAVTDPTTTPGNPVIVFPNGGPASATYPDANGQVYAYPNPNDPTAYGALPLITGSVGAWSSVAGQLFVHESRVVVFAAGDYGWPAGGGFITNENVNFTDPPNSTDYGDQLEVFQAEEPFGYGAAGSISAGELFLVKKRGGGLQVQGDLLTPSVTYLPGVQPTGGIYGRGSSGMAGFAYCSLDNGAWIWNGSNTSQKISQQLDDNFFLPPEFETMASNNYGFFAECIGDKIYFCNNWLYDIRTNSWWRYYRHPSQAGGQGVSLFWVNQVSGPDIYAAVLSFTSEDTNYAFRFNQNTPAYSWQWQSLPQRVTNDRLIEPRLMVVRGSTNPGDTGNSTIQVQFLVQQTVVGSVTTPAGDLEAYPTMIRMPIGSQSGDTSIPYQGEDFTIRIIADGAGGPAPNLHSLGVAWSQRQHAPTVGVTS